MRANYIDPVEAINIASQWANNGINDVAEYCYVDHGTLIKQCKDYIPEKYHEQFEQEYWEEYGDEEE